MFDLLTTTATGSVLMEQFFKHGRRRHTRRSSARCCRYRRTCGKRTVATCCWESCHPRYSRTHACAYRPPGLEPSCRLAPKQAHTYIPLQHPTYMRAPPKWQVQNYNCLYGAIFEHIRASGREVTEANIDTAEHSERSFPLVCFPITDHAPTCEGKEAVSRDIFLMFNHIVEDTRGLPNPVCSKQAPSVVGSDPTCNQKGVHLEACKTTVYPGAVRLLGRRYFAMCTCMLCVNVVCMCAYM